MEEDNEKAGRTRERHGWTLKEGKKKKKEEMSGFENQRGRDL
jgi:hypothetical protein